MGGFGLESLDICDRSAAEATDFPSLDCCEDKNGWIALRRRNLSFSNRIARSSNNKQNYNNSIDNWHKQQR